MRTPAEAAATAAAAAAAAPGGPGGGGDDINPELVETGEIEPTGEIPEKDDLLAKTLGVPLLLTNS